MITENNKNSITHFIMGCVVSGHFPKGIDYETADLGEGSDFFDGHVLNWRTAKFFASIEDSVLSSGSTSMVII